MTIPQTALNLGAVPQIRFWAAVALLESGSAAAFMALIAFGPFFRSPQPLLWLVGALAAMAAYLYLDLWAISSMLSEAVSRKGRGRLLPWLSTLPFLAGFSTWLALLQLRPAVGGLVWYLLSPIQPFPAIAMALLFLSVALLKVAAVSLCLPARSDPRARLHVGAADAAIPVALLLIGVLQASVYLTPIGNAFLRFWAIADAIPMGIGYPVVHTEPAPMAAGSPPYVYDLPLFPLMLLAAFSLLGHNSATAHLPAAFWNALFPLSLYLLIREATGSRVTALVFAALGALFPYLRFWVLNLPDPDPFIMTSLCLAGYLYLRALAAPDRSWRWVGAGLASGMLSLARPEGILYAGFLTLGVLAHRPGLKQLALFLSALGLFLAPMVAVWFANFGFLWPQNYNRTLGMEYPLKNLEILKGTGALLFYQRGLGLDETSGVGLLLVFAASVLFGTLAMAVRAPRLLAMALPGIGNSVTIFFANPWIPNTYHFADFFRHASFGIPFLILTSAYAFHLAYRHLLARRRLRVVGYLCLLLLVAAVVREGDILANPTVTHRPRDHWPPPTQVLTAYTHLSMQGILEHPMPLPTMTYRREDSLVVAYPTFMKWPEDALAHYKPLDMAFESNGRPFGYASVMAFLVALGFALVAENPVRSGRPDTKGPRGSIAT